MTGKIAWEYICENKNILETVVIVDIEYGRLKYVYDRDVEKINDDLFKNDDGSWDSEDDDCFTWLHGVTFKNDFSYLSTTTVDTNWYIDVRNKHGK